MKHTTDQYRPASEIITVRDSACHLIGIASLICTLLLTSCAQKFPVIHYRLSVIVETPEGRRFGSSVLEYRSHISPAFPGPEAGGFRSYLQGEAVSVRLSNGKYIFSTFQWLCRYDQFNELLNDSFSKDLQPIADGDGKSHSMLKQRALALKNARGIRVVNPNFYPIFVAFKNPSDLNSLVYSPDGKIDKLYRGAKLIGMTIEVVDAPVTHNIERLLPWIKTSNIGLYDPACYKDSDDNTPKFGTDDFIHR